MYVCVSHMYVCTLEKHSLERLRPCPSHPAHHIYVHVMPPISLCMFYICNNRLSFVAGIDHLHTSQFIDTSLMSYVSFKIYDNLVFFSGNLLGH